MINREEKYIARVILETEQRVAKELLDMMEEKPAGGSFFKILRDYQEKEVKKKYGIE